MRVNALVVDLALLGRGRLGVPRALTAALPGLASWSAPAARASPSACAACGWAPTTGSPSPATPRRSSRAWRPSCAGASGLRARGRPARSWPASSRSGPTSSRPSPRGSSVDLTRREFEVLQLLAQAEGKVLQREEIYQAVWGYAMAHGDRSVDVFVRKVRQKLEKASPDWSYIHTHFGVGYRFEPERRDGAEAGVARAGGRRAARSWTTTSQRLSARRRARAGRGAPACASGCRPGVGRR